MNQNVINFYLMANKLKDIVRTGWKKVKISKERIESVADHVYGCLILTIALDSEYKLGLDMLKVFKMIVIKELSKVNLDKEYSPEGNVDRKEEARQTVLSVVGCLADKEELMALFDEIESKSSKEAIFVSNVTKIESDLQAKIYDLNGQFSLENALADVKNYGEKLAAEILPQVKNASDGWLLFDRRYYAGDEMFENLSKDIQNLNELLEN